MRVNPGKVRALQDEVAKLERDRETWRVIHAAEGDRRKLRTEQTANAKAAQADAERLRVVEEAKGEKQARELAPALAALFWAIFPEPGVRTSQTTNAGQLKVLRRALEIASKDPARPFGALNFAGALQSIIHHLT